MREGRGRPWSSLSAGSSQAAWPDVQGTDPANRPGSVPSLEISLCQVAARLADRPGAFRVETKARTLSTVCARADLVTRRNREDTRRLAEAVDLPEMLPGFVRHDGHRLSPPSWGLSCGVGNACASSFDRVPTRISDGRNPCVPAESRRARAPLGCGGC